MENYTPQNISHLLARIGKAHRGLANQYFGEIGLHVGQDAILRQLWREDGLTQSEVAGRLCIQPATVTKMLQRMAQSGFIERRADTRDQRVSRVYLTAGGRELETRVCAVWQQLEQELTAALSAEEIETLRTLLRCVHGSLYANGERSEEKQPESV